MARTTWFHQSGAASNCDEGPSPSFARIDVSAFLDVVSVRPSQCTGPCASRRGVAWRAARRGALRSNRPGPRDCGLGDDLIVAVKDACGGMAPTSADPFWSSQDSVDTPFRSSVSRFELLRAHAIEVAVPT